MNVRHSFSIKNTFHDKMDLRFNGFIVYLFIQGTRYDPRFLKVFRGALFFRGDACTEVSTRCTKNPTPEFLILSTLSLNLNLCHNYILQTQKRLLLIWVLPSVWMNHSRTVNSHSNGIYDGALSSAYNDFTSSFSELLKKDIYRTIHHCH